MKQLFQSLSDGSTNLFDLPVPTVSPGHLLVRSSCSLVSSGTERTLVEFGKANLIDKARQQPDRVSDVLTKARTDGIKTTADAVFSKLDQPLPLGYCHVGQVVAIGEGVVGFNVGDRVATNGPHAELVVVPKHLCAVIPPAVTDESAAFTVLASIGLQGIRLANPTFGETFVVSGLGLIGLLTCQLLAAQGCRVLGLDPDPAKCSLAEQLGIIALTLGGDVDPVAWCMTQTGGFGVDGVLVTASTSSSEPIHVAAQACRQRGRIVLVGVTGLQLRRELFYKKELSFQVSSSYGPGRYDPVYEKEGHDYPIGFVRWTEQRNFQAVLQAFANGSVRTDLLISHRFPIDDAASAYELLSSSESSLGILLQYPGNVDIYKRSVTLSDHLSSASFGKSAKPFLGVIGAGNYATRMLIPAFSKVGASFHTVAASSGSGPVHVGRKFRFRHATTDLAGLMSDETCNSLVIATRHDSHASLVTKALSSRKHVFVEKPLCLTTDQLLSIKEAYTGDHLLMVGFNRRFAPLFVELQQLLKQLNGPKAFVYTCNAGSIPPDHWTQDPTLGGGRLLGEACHFVDLMRCAADSPLEDLQLLSASDSKPCPDTFSLQMKFADGSIGSVHYFANGNKGYPKERLEVFGSGKILLLDNFRKLKAWGIPGFRSRRLLRQDKGQEACCRAFLQAIEFNQSQPIPVSEIFEVQHWLLEALEN